MTRSMLKTAVTAVLALFFLHAAAWASCTVTGSGPSTTTIVVAGLSSGKVNVPRGSPVGTTVWTSPTYNLPAANVNCTGQAYAVAAAALAATGTPNVYQTDIPYLGLKIVEVTSFTTVTNTPKTWYTPPPNSSATLAPAYQLSLVVIAPVTSNLSSSISVPVAQDYVSDSATALVNQRELHRVQISSFNTQVTGNSPCTPANVSVNLGSHAATEFGAVGTSTAATPFTIELRNCPAGMRRIAYQIDPVTAVLSGTGNSVVALDGSATASGVGVQLLDGAGAPLALGSQQTVGDSGGSYSIALRARYYKTSPFVRGGSAGSAMTFTITYN